MKGGYANGEKNGLGKEFSEFGELIFEGEYLNDLKKIGKEYAFNYTLEFEGEYLNGERWNGAGKEYNKESGYSVGKIKYSNGKKTFE